MYDYKKLTLEQMVEYIEKNAPTDKAWFKAAAFDGGKYSHLKAKKAFAQKYMPEIIPVAKAKKTSKAASLLANW